MARGCRGSRLPQVAREKSGARVLARHREPALRRGHRHSRGSRALRGQHRPSACLAGGLRAGSGCMIDAAAAIRLRLILARACAWALLVAGWIGIGSFALLIAPSTTGGFALVALW